ncbi:MAG TPA: phosphoglucomutase (alpha-D-glucose-1,6-bisphosphate-dependent) [Candidatus Corynebacterium gallistercoris]|uniref:Phosphoglucomutase (Alpha-D-glucose-1,6-bisphosphate-dependent) n=1 Tax=Candidatus Corynebacterium gallistercoris TaxID=2838530 RepID=A0A9D1RW92_9CORY|nr:phosphoglucomutase (alpha-D-glucose-1,6-bisphosphate-dependent) [Candidatus Corynebacterium gallistercoris]
MHPRAGQLASPDDLTDIPALLDAYASVKPDPADPAQQVTFGTSGHRGSALDATFNEDHILATTQAIVDYRRSQGIAGPLFLGRDTHALSEPAHATAVEVLAGNGVDVRVDAAGRFVPTPAISHAILTHQGSDGIVITPSHNPPRDGGFKYNPPTGGPADTDATTWIADKANEYLAQGLAGVQRSTSTDTVSSYDFLNAYVADLPQVVDLEAIRAAGVSIGADPMGGASVDYWERIAEVHGLDLTVVNDQVDPAFGFMALDTDGLIRMDCSSPAAMASLVANREKFDIATGNDADADRHGIVTPDAGLMNPNHYLAVMIEYLFTHRPGWPKSASVGKTLVSSSLIDRVADSVGARVLEVPVGFKWFVPGLLDSTVGFGGEESAGASFLRFNGAPWSTDKDGIIADLLASEIKATTGKSPSARFAELADQLGRPTYTRIDAPATREQKQRLKNLSAKDVTATELAGEKIAHVLTEAPGNCAPIGGVKVTTDNAWFAARPSGTEDKYKIYAESFQGEGHLERVLEEAQAVVDAVL